MMHDKNNNSVGETKSTNSGTAAAVRLPGIVLKRKYTIE